MRNEVKHRALSLVIGARRDPLASFLRIWQKNATQDSGSNVPINWLNTANTRNLLPGINNATKLNIRNKDVLGSNRNKTQLRQEIEKEKAEIVDSLGRLEKGLEDALAQTRENVPTPQPPPYGYNFGNRQPFRGGAFRPGPSNFHVVENGRHYNPLTAQYDDFMSNKLTDGRNSHKDTLKKTDISQTPTMGSNQLINRYNAGSVTPQRLFKPFLPNVIQRKANDEFQRQRLLPNQIANELKSNINLQTQSLRFNQVVSKPINNELSKPQSVPFNNQQRNSTEFDDGYPSTSQPPYNNDFNLPNQQYVNPYLNSGEMIQSYVGKPPQSPPLEHAYPLSHDNEALLPPLNHQQLPPLNHNDLVSTETSSYTGSDVNSFSSPGKENIIFLTKNLEQIG